jgi:hypothetical protein
MHATRMYLWNPQTPDLVSMYTYLSHCLLSFGDISSESFFFMVYCCHSSINVLYQVISNHSTSITVLYRIDSDSRSSNMAGNKAFRDCYRCENVLDSCDCRRLLIML